MSLLTTKQVVVRIALIISGAEFAIMLLLHEIFLVDIYLNIYLEAMANTILLATIATPAFYFWVIKPFVDSRDDVLAQINHLAHSDPLTGLDNRRRIMESLEESIASSIRHKEYAAVLLMDLDSFKLINDRYGHEAGDEVLVTIANRMKAIVRPEDTVGRLGGDEFVILVKRLCVDRAVAQENATIVAKKLIELMSDPIIFKGNALSVGASIGIRLIGTAELDSGVAMNEVDHAMYRAKQESGGEGFCFVENGT